MQLGATYEDKISGFKGIATGHCRYLTGCNQTLLSPKCDEKGALQDGRWFDDQRLVKVGTDILTLDNGSTPGCDIPAPVR